MSQELDPNTNPEVDPQQNPTTPGVKNTQEPGKLEPQTFSLEYVQELRREAAAHRTKANDATKQLDELKTSSEAMAIELATMKTQFTQMTVRSTIDSVTTELGAVYPDLVAEKVDLDKIEYDEDGTPVKESILKQVEPLKEAYPALFAAQEPKTPETNLGIKGSAPTPFDPNTATPEQAAEYYKSLYRK